ncbi:glycosyltransferase family 2 protein [Neobacillus mesonae]|uniref:glycosyltransferase family 2 protein n=1 Tax=Neobacillus mesonae TaxID=1193713 RepID=UPI0025747A5A|nr:glycosyltransferase family A protein [Neobacillus mesonae]
MEQPLVSVVIPFFSGVKWLEEALNSVLSQTYKNVEILVINDGSKENFNDAVQKLNSPINVINKKNGGPASARNTGIEKASGKYIAFLDSDDTWLPDKLSKQIKEMEAKNYIWTHHSYEMFWENQTKTKRIDTSIYSGDVYRDCFISFKVQTSCVVVLRDVLIKHNIRFPLEKRFGQDTDFYKQIAKKYPIGYIEGVLSRFRIRGSNAGFRAWVQINDKATTWREIKKENSLLKILPRPIIFAYKVSSLFSKWIAFLNKSLKKKQGTLEVISKLMYVFPYTIFKLYSKKQI